MYCTIEKGPGQWFGTGKGVKSEVRRGRQEASKTKTNVTPPEFERTHMIFTLTISKLTNTHISLNR
jgi:hypothetical protein